MMKNLSMNILDIVQNSIRANSKHINISIDENSVSNYFLFSIEDDGCGMDSELINKVCNPFTTSRTTRKIGLGIPLLNQTCQMCGGKLELESTVGQGTLLTASMEYNNIDRPPLGDIVEVVFILIVSNPKINFRYLHTFNGKTYSLNTEEINSVLDGISITHPDVMEWLKQSLKEGIDKLYV